MKETESDPANHGAPDDVGDAGLVLQREKDKALGRPGPLARDHRACDTHAAARARRAASLGRQPARAGEHITLTRGAEESPSNVGAAGSEDVLVWIRADAQRETGFWIWAAADNLRVLALNAIDAAQQMAAAMPKGKLQ